MLRYVGNGNFEFDKDSGETVILSDRDLIKLRLTMGQANKEHNTALASVMEQSRLEKPINPNKSPRSRKGR